MEKPLLIARLAADRARLLHACLGLNEPMLTQRLVLGDWTILNMLAGAGEYDALYASVIPEALSGQLKDSGIHDLAAHDFTLRDRFAGWDVAVNLIRRNLMVAFQTQAFSDLQQRVGSIYAGLNECVGVHDGAIDMGFGREIHDGVDLVIFNSFLNRCPIADITANKRIARIGIHFQ